MAGFLFAALAFCAATLGLAPSHAESFDRVYLRDGRVLEGEIAREHNGSVWLVHEVDGAEQKSFLGATEIVRIERDSATPLQAANPDQRPDSREQPTLTNGSSSSDAAPPVPRFDPAGAERCSVARVVDGDTIVLDRGGDPETVRLVGVDTPETVDPRKPVQRYGREASAFLSNLLRGEEVYVAYERPGHADKYGRSLAHIYRAPDGLWVNLELVRQGYAQVYTGEAFEHIDLFLAYQRRAREAEKGLWGPEPDGQPEQDVATAPTRPAPAPQTAPPTQEVKPVPQKVTVYITRTGSKYHRAGCSYLRRSSIPIDLEEAKGRYGACSRCSPPR